MIPVEDMQVDPSVAAESEVISTGGNSIACQQSEKRSEEQKGEEQGMCHQSEQQQPAEQPTEPTEPPEPPELAKIPKDKDEDEEMIAAISEEPEGEMLAEIPKEPTELAAVPEEEGEQEGEKSWEEGEDGIYTVQAVVDDRIIGGQKFYRIRWKGYGPEDDTWEPVNEDFQCMELANEYERRKKIKSMGSLYAKGFNLSRLYNIPSLHKIRVINEVDKEQLPEDFVYTDGYVRGKGVPYPSGMVFPCSCAGPKCGADCECMGVSCYDDRGRLCVELRYPIHECNYLCKCSINCPNRIVQRGNPVQADIFRTESKGWGVRTRRIIYKGEYVCRYTGELLTFEESTKRNVEQTTYIFDLDHGIPRDFDSHFAVDACKYGNVSHFFNHSCDPNLEIRAVYINHLDPRMHELAFFASRDIAVNEELTFDYSPGLKLTMTQPEIMNADPNEEPKNFRCYCGTSFCRKYIFN